MGTWFCRVCDASAVPKYRMKRGVTYFVGWECTRCGAVQDSKIGETRMSENG